MRVEERNETCTIHRREQDSSLAKWRKNVGAVQSRPIDNDPQFLTIRDAINPLLARHGFPLLSYKGSASWRAGATDPNRSTETYFKLIYRGRGKPFIFGIRKDFASEIEKLRGSVQVQVTLAR